MNAAAESSPDRKHGRTAVALHLAGVLFIAGGISVFVLLGATLEAYHALGVSVSAWSVLTVWSLALSIRALLKRESALFVYAVLLLLLFEFSAVLQLLWIFNYERWAWWRFYPLTLSFVQWAFHYGLPIFAPCVVLMNLAGAATFAGNAWLLRRRALNAGVSGARPQQFRLIASAAAAALLTAVVCLPLPLFLFCASRSMPADWMEPEYMENSMAIVTESDWREQVTKKSPDILRDAVDSALSYSVLRCYDDFHWQLVIRGNMSRARLIRYAFDPQSKLNQVAVKGLMVCGADYDVVFSEVMKARAEAVARNGPWADRMAAHLAATFGSQSQIKSIFSTWNRYSAAFREDLLKEGAIQKSYLDEINYLALHDSTHRNETLRVAAAHFSSENVIALWTYLLHGNSQARHGAASLIGAVQQPETHFELVRIYLDQKNDPELQRAVLHSPGVRIASMDNLTKGHWISMVRTMLNSNDCTLRRSAVWVLADLLKITDRITRTPNVLSHTLSGDTADAPELPGEGAELEMVEAACDAWFLRLVMAKD